MSIDYDGVGGIGILIDDKIVNALIAAGKFTQDDWDNDAGYCLDKAKCQHLTAGNAFVGEFRYYAMVDGDTLAEVVDNANEFIGDMKSIGVDVSFEDIKVISDIYIN